MEKKPKVLLTYIESGMGHITSMKSIEDNLQKFSDKLNLIEDYLMETSSATKIYEKFIAMQVKQCMKHPLFGGFIFWFLGIFGGLESMSFLHHSIFYAGYHDVFEHFVKEEPDVIISTHYFISYVANNYKLKHNPNCIVITYNPDNNTHVWWDGRTGLFLVNNELAKEEAIAKRGFKEENIIEVGLTKRQALLDCTESKEFFRDKFNLPQNKFTVLVTDGAYAVGRSKSFCKYLLQTKKEITILYMAGQNIKVHYYFLKKRARLEKKGKKNITFKILEFMPNIHEIYKACDLVITKGGPNTLLDCALMGTPFIVNLCPQPMEKAAYQLFVKKYHCGIGVFRDFQIRQVVENFIDHPDLLDVYKQNLKRFQDMPNGAEKISEVIENELKKNNLL